MFQFVVTPAGLREVEGRNLAQYTQWVNDVRDVWLVQSAGREVPLWGEKFNGRRFGMISRKDRILLQDALDLRCDAFMTMERRLPTAAEFIERETGLRIMRPTTYWGLGSLGRPVLLTDRDSPRLHHPCTQPAGYRSFTLRRSKADALALLDERSCGLLLADGSNSYQPAHIERSSVELVVASAFPCLGESLKLSAQRSKSIGSGPLWHSSGPD
jgi:hypothetical protein